jgi:hypothetical protein
VLSAIPDVVRAHSNFRRELPERCRNSDHARDLRIYESVGAQAKGGRGCSKRNGSTGRNCSGLLETSSSRQFLSLKHSGLAWRASPLTRRGTSQIVSAGRLSIAGARNETGSQRDDLNKCTLQASQ